MTETVEVKANKQTKKTTRINEFDIENALEINTICCHCVEDDDIFKYPHVFSDQLILGSCIWIKLFNLDLWRFKYP